MIGAHAALLAQIANWRRLGDGIHRPGSGGDYADLIPVVAMFAVIGVLVWVVQFYRNRNDFSLPSNDPAKLFRELCQAHGLDYGSSRLLRRLAEAADLKEPAEVFVSPEVFGADRLPKRLAAEQERIESLRERLF